MSNCVRAHDDGMVDNQRLRDRSRPSALRGQLLAAWASALLVAGVTSAFAQDPSVVSNGSIAQNTTFGQSSSSAFSVPGKMDATQPLYLQGDELIYDSSGERVTARGNVEITYTGYVLTADEVVYDQSANTLSASGNVVLRDPNGGITRTERLTLTDDFRDGFIQSLSIVAKDNTRITARRAVRRDGNVTEFEQGKFTPCKHDAGKPPLWCISAAQVVHDKNAATITYLDAAFNVFGVPIAYVPYFQHADPSVKRRSGFLLPRFASSEDLGFGTEIPYYFALSPSYDFTFHPLYTAKQGVLWKGTWRQKLAFGDVRGQYNIKLAGIDQDAGQLPNNDQSLDGWRGSVQTRGDFSLASWWKFGWDVTLESDDTFRRFYKLDNILQTDRVNTVHFTGISERNFFQVKGYHFGGLLLSDEEHSESRVHPIVDWNYVMGTPVLGGELSWNVNALSFSRDLRFVDATQTTIDTGTDSQRLVADVNWRRRLIDPLGITYTPFANVRGDLLTYNNAVDPVNNVLIDGDTTARGVASAGLLASYPWLARTQTASHVIEPVGQIIARTASVSQRHLPNEDARSLVFDDTNLFALNKTSGLDRVETGTRANVGVQYTFQADSGQYARFLIGQSYHLSGENIYALVSGREPSENPLTAANVLTPRNGLEESRSDYVLGAYLAPSQMFLFIGQARFDNDELSMRRADATARVTYGPAVLHTTYTYTASDPLVLSTSDQQEVLASVGLRLADHWYFLGTLRYDIDDSEFRSHSLGLRYSDDCFMLTATYSETNTNNADITSDRTIMLHFALKHIGEFSYNADALDHLFGENQG